MNTPRLSSLFRPALVAAGFVVSATAAHAGGVYWSVNVNAPVQGVGYVSTAVANAPRAYYGAPVVYAPAPVVYAPAPVVYGPPAVVVQPQPLYGVAPVVYQPAPRYVVPGYGWRRHHHHHHDWD